MIKVRTVDGSIVQGEPVWTPETQSLMADIRGRLHMLAYEYFGYESIPGLQDEEQEFWGRFREWEDLLRRLGLAVECACPAPDAPLPEADGSGPVADAGVGAATPAAATDNAGAEDDLTIRNADTNGT